MMTNNAVQSPYQIRVAADELLLVHIVGMATIVVVRLVRVEIPHQAYAVVITGEKLPQQDELAVVSDIT